MCYCKQNSKRAKKTEPTLCKDDLSPLGPLLKIRILPYSLYLDSGTPRLSGPRPIQTPQTLIKNLLELTGRTGLGMKSLEVAFCFPSKPIFAEQSSAIIPILSTVLLDHGLEKLTVLGSGDLRRVGLYGLPCGPAVMFALMS